MAMLLPATAENVKSPVVEHTLRLAPLILLPPAFRSFDRVGVSPVKKAVFEVSTVPDTDLMLVLSP